MNKIPELLAPAGSLACLKAAVSAGADAVYFGGQAFNARRGAGNLTTGEIREAVVFCKMRGVKTHLTLNILIKQKEWPSLRAYLQETLSQGIDAVIVQDLGVAALVREMFPEVELHGSTQMAVHDAAGVRFLEELGFSRVVLSREVSLEEIRQIRQGTKAELEVFIHGALCYCYSGRCLLSSFHGGRSGNRGTCAQPCRMLYETEGQKAFAMNLKDLCAAPYLQELIEAGVDSFKIEGRMKGIPYVAGITAIYRELLDCYGQSGQVPVLKAEQWLEMKQLFNRGEFTDRYLTDKKDMIYQTSPKHQGIVVGRVEQVRGNYVTLTLDTEVSAGDELEIRSGRAPFPQIRLAASMIHGKTVRFQLDEKVEKGQEVYRLIDLALNRRLQEKAEQEPKVPVEMAARFIVGQPAELTITCGNIQVTLQGSEVQQARHCCMSAEDLRKQLEKVGDTCFLAQNIRIDIQGCVFVPVSALNQLRRDALQQLEKRLCPPIRVPQSAKNLHPFTGQNEQRQVQVATIAQWKTVLQSGMCPDVILPAVGIFDTNLLYQTREQGVQIIPVLPMISRLRHVAALKADVEMWAQQGVTVFEAQHLGQVRLLQEWGFTARAGFGLAVMNHNAAAFWQKHTGSFYISAELTGQEGKELTGFAGATQLVYGKIPLMVTEQCFYKERRGCKPVAEGHVVQVKDRLQQTMAAHSHCQSCYSVLYEGTPIWLGDKRLSGVNERVIFVDEDEARMREVWQAFQDRTALYGTQRGHYTKGVV